jgi:hypothetical protein
MQGVCTAHNQAAQNVYYAASAYCAEQKLQSIKQKHFLSPGILFLWTK